MQTKNKIPKIPNDYFDVKELAAYWKVSVRTVYEMTRKGTVPFIRIGGQIRFKIEDIKNYKREGNGKRTD